MQPTPKNIKVGDTIYHKTARNADGTASRAKVTSVRTWKRSPKRYEIRWKHGLYTYGTITDTMGQYWETTPSR